MRREIEKKPSRDDRGGFFVLSGRRIGIRMRLFLE